MADTLGMHYFETSATENTNVNESAQEIINLTYEKIYPNNQIEEESESSVSDFYRQK